MIVPAGPPQLKPLPATGRVQGVAELQAAPWYDPLVCCSKNAAWLLVASICSLNVSWMAVFGGTTPLGADSTTAGAGTVSLPSPVVKVDVTCVPMPIRPLPADAAACVVTVTWKAMNGIASGLAGTNSSMLGFGQLYAPGTWHGAL